MILFKVIQKCINLITKRNSSNFHNIDGKKIYKIEKVSSQYPLSSLRESNQVRKKFESMCFMRTLLFLGLSYICRNVIDKRFLCKLICLPKLYACLLSTDLILSPFEQGRNLIPKFSRFFITFHTFKIILFLIFFYNIQSSSLLQSVVQQFHFKSPSTLVCISCAKVENRKQTSRKRNITITTTKIT